MRTRLLAYKQGSRSARDLSRAMGILRIRQNSSKFIARNGDTVIHWGFNDKKVLRKNGANVIHINPPENVYKVTNKLRAFNNLQELGINIPKFTTDPQEAITWLASGECRRVFCRTELSGHSGEGIIVARSPEEIVGARLYVQGIAKAREFRVHVMNGKVIDFAEKKAREGARELLEWNADVRSYSNGWVFCREGVDLPDNVSRESIKAVTGLGLDFAAVDICVEKNTDKAIVFELNTSPALEGTTLETYANELFNLVI